MNEYLIKITEIRTIDLTVQAECKARAEELARAASLNEYEDTDSVSVDQIVPEITKVQFFDRVDEDPDE